MQTDKILEELYTALHEIESEEIDLAKKEETGLPYDMIVMLLSGFGSQTNTAQCEIYFLPKEALGDIMFFFRINLTEKVVEENIPGLCAEIAATNYDLPFGAFSFDLAENAVVYQANLPMTDALTEAEIREVAEGCIATGISVARRFSETIIPSATTWRR